MHSIGIECFSGGTQPTLVKIERVGLLECFFRGRTEEPEPEGRKNKMGNVNFFERAMEKSNAPLDEFNLVGYCEAVAETIEAMENKPLQEMAATIFDEIRENQMKGVRKWRKVLSEFLKEAGDYIPAIGRFQLWKVVYGLNSDVLMAETKENRFKIVEGLVYITALASENLVPLRFNTNQRGESPEFEVRIHQIMNPVESAFDVI
jgi:hypothetical protein